MGQKCHPLLMRAGKVEKNADPRSGISQFGYKTYNFWAKTPKEYSIKLNTACAIEGFLRKKFKRDGLGEIYITFVQNIATIDIFSTKVGVILGKNASGIESIRKEVLKLGKKAGIEVVTINPHEIKKPGLDAHVVCENICKEIESKRGAVNVKKAAEAAMKAGALGVKIQASGRISGAEIARSEKVSKGRINATSLKANISYAQNTALTTYGIIGVSVFINNHNHADRVSSYSDRSTRYSDSFDSKPDRSDNYNDRANKGSDRQRRK